jgi:hypothetical protein
MQFNADFTGDAAVIARQHRPLLERLPATVHAFIAVELLKWPTLFAAEQRYQRALLDHLSSLPQARLREAVAGIEAVEKQAGTGSIASRDPAGFQEDAQALLRRRQLLQPWRMAVDAFFQQVDPAIEARLFPPDAPRRLVVQVYAGAIAVQPHNLWRRFEGVGVRVPVALDDAGGSDKFLRALFGAPRAGRTTLFADASAGAWPLATWIVEAHESLHRLCEQDRGRHEGGGAIAGLSYDRLREYRDDLTRALFSKIQSGVESPQAFAAYARSLKIAPRAGALLDRADILQAFVRDVFLTGNGTLFVNNTFVEWAAVQALRRAQPRMLAIRYGVRDRLKPFSSLLLFSQPRPTDQIPLIEDPVGSFVDVEQLSYYVWLNAEKSPAYRKKTLYLFLAEGIDQMLAIRSDRPVMDGPAVPAATLADVRATMAHWLGTSSPDSPGQPIAPLIDG